MFRDGPVGTLDASGSEVHLDTVQVEGLVPHCGRGGSSPLSDPITEVPWSGTECPERPVLSGLSAFRALGLEVFLLCPQVILSGRAVRGVVLVSGTLFGTSGTSTGTFEGSATGQTIRPARTTRRGVSVAPGRGGQEPLGTPIETFPPFPSRSGGGLAFACRGQCVPAGLGFSRVSGFRFRGA